MMGFLDSADAENQQSTAFGNQYSGDVFADVNNLDHCIKYLNQALTTFGFPSTLHLHSNEPASIVETCNCLYALLQQRQRDIEFRDAANDQKQRLMSDMTRLEAKLERQEAQLLAKERELAALTSKEQKAAAAFKAQLEKLQQERDEFQRMVVSTQQVRVQQSHELKKKEKEYARLQEKLNQVLTEKKKETKPAFEILTLLQKEGRQRGTWNSKKDNDNFSKMILDAYEAKKQELMAENADLRSLLRSMQSDMRDFLNTHNGMGKASSVNGSFDGDRPSTPLAGRTDLFDLPFHMARDQIEQSLRTKMASIKERMMQLQESQQAVRTNTEASDRELELEAQLVEARSIITEQVSLMNKQLAEDPRTPAHLQVTGKGGTMFLGAVEDRVASEEWSAQLEAERSAIKKMTADLERERIEVDKAKERLQNDMWPENQKFKSDVAQTGCESLNQEETQGSVVNAEMDRLRMRLDLPEAQESPEVPAENQARLISVLYSLSQGKPVPAQTENEDTGIADPLDTKTRTFSEEKKWPEDSIKSDVTFFVYDPQKAETSSQTLRKETYSASQGNSFRAHGKFITSQDTGSVSRSSRIYDNPSFAVLDCSLNPEAETSLTVERYVSRASHKRTTSKVETTTELVRRQSSGLVERTEDWRASPHEISRTESQRVLARKQVQHKSSTVVGSSDYESGQLFERDANHSSNRRTASNGQDYTDFSRMGHRGEGSRGENSIGLIRHEDGGQAKRTETSNALPDEISRTENQRLLAGKQVEQSFKSTKLAHSCTSSRLNSEQRIHPGFLHIADDAWVDDSQSVQNATSEQELQRMSSKAAQSQRSQSSSRVESKRVGEPVHRSSSLMDVASTTSGRKKKRKVEQVSCGCLRVFKRSSIKV